MAIDYTVIMNVRHQFGEEDVDIGVFAGTEREFIFDCPGVDHDETAVLMFQTYGVDRQQGLEINGSIVFGGVPSGANVAGFTDPAPGEIPDGVMASLFGWSGQVLLVTPGTLRASGNTMTVRWSPAGPWEPDYFLLDNVVLLYKTGGQPGLSPGGVVAAEQA